MPNRALIDKRKKQGKGERGKKEKKGRKLMRTINYAFFFSNQELIMILFIELVKTISFPNSPTKKNPMSIHFITNGHQYELV